MCAMYCVFCENNYKILLYLYFFFLIVYFSVTIASNSIEIYSLFEHMHIALIQTANDDPNFISIITNRDSEEDSSDPTMESLLREINELIIKIDEIIG